METKFQTSFIPKTNLEPSVGGVKKPIGLLTFIATIIFFITVLVAGGAFGYETYLENQTAKMKKDLDDNIKNFEPQALSEYVRLNTRLNAAEQLLAKHVAVSYVLDFLSENTLQSVSFNDFKYSVAADGTASLSVNGVAKSYNAVAYQSEVFAKEHSLVDPIFSNLDLDNNGNVLFNFSTNIIPGFITYTRKAPQSTDSTSQDIVPIDTMSSNQSSVVPTTTRATSTKQ